MYVRLLMQQRLRAPSKQLSPNIDLHRSRTRTRMVLATIVALGLAGTSIANAREFASSGAPPAVSSPDVASSLVLASSLPSRTASAVNPTATTLPTSTSAPTSISTNGLASALTSASGASGASGTSGASATIGPLKALRVITKPVHAWVVATGTDGVRHEGVSPFSAQVPTGEVKLTVLGSGYSERTDLINITGDTKLDQWLSPSGQLHKKRYEVKTGSNPKQVAFTPDGKQLWVTLLGSRGVQVFDTATGTLLDVIIMGTRGGAVEVIFKADGTRAYVSQMETASVYEVDTQKRKVLRQFGTGGNWTKILALSPDEKTLYAANWVSNDVSVIDLASGALVKKIPTVKTPRGVIITPDGKRMFIAGFDGGELERIDLVSGDRKIMLATGGAMRHLALDEKAKRIYADDMATGTAHIIDIEKETVTTLGKTDAFPNSIDLSPDGKYLYVSNRGENNPISYSIPGPEWGSVVVIDTATGKTVDAMVGGNQTTGLDVSPDGKLLAFTDFLDNRLTLMDIPSPQVLAASTGGYAPQHKAALIKPNFKSGKPSEAQTIATKSKSKKEKNA
jgi:YVTN family beta-propeller protein